MSAAKLSSRVAAQIVKATLVDAEHVQLSIADRAAATSADFAQAVGRQLPPELAQRGAEHELDAYRLLLAIATGDEREPRVAARAYVQDVAQWCLAMAAELNADNEVRT